MRREFSKAVKREIIIRSWPLPHDESGFRRTCCEKCGAECKRFEIDHRLPDALHINKQAPLTAADGWLLCIPCHKEKTAQDVPDIAQAKRREAAHLGVKSTSDRPMGRRKKPDKPPLRVAPGETNLTRRYK